MSVISLVLLSSESDSGAVSRMSALPEMAVRGVLRSCEIDLSKLALSCSFLASTAASSRSRTARSRSSAMAASPTTERQVACSSSSRASPQDMMPTTPKVSFGV